MSWFIASKNPVAILLRVFSLPVAVPLIGVAALMTDALADGTPQPKFRTDVWQYITATTPPD